MYHDAIELGAKLILQILGFWMMIASNMDVKKKPKAKKLVTIIIDVLGKIDLTHGLPAGFAFVIACYFH